MDVLKCPAEVLAMRYGDVMKPLALAELELLDDMRNDPDVIRYIHLLDKSLRAEKISDPDDWSTEQAAAWDKGDWETFSRLRGYTEDEISAFRQKLDLCYFLIERYGEDDMAWVSYTLQEQTGILGLTPKELLKRR